MKRFQRIWNICFALALTGFTGYALADTFLISRVYAVVEQPEYVAGVDTSTASASLAGDGETDVAVGGTNPTADPTTEGSAAEGSATEETGSSAASAANGQAQAAEPFTQEPVITDESYTDAHIAVTVTSYRAYDTTIHVADIVVDSPAYLRTYLAQNAYGHNVTEKTSEMAADVGAILAINGDYYGTRERGYVIRNGVLYRDTATEGQEDLVIYEDGSFAVVSEDEVSAQELLDDGAVQVFSFGPALVENGVVTVGASDEVDQSMASNPRTAIGILSDTHYVMVVSDGRTGDDEGLSLYELAEFMQGLDVETAYNLDGGGSSTMVFNGTVVNTPTGGRAGHGARGSGSGASERGVSDIIYIGA